MPPEPPPDKYGDILKLVQIAFYTIGAIVAILTYRAARRGLLNTVNTEYQKRVMDRLQRLSEDLYSEFDSTSETYWAAMNPVRDAIAIIDEVFKLHQEDILSEGKYTFGTPITADIQRLQRLLEPAKSDPFIPEIIRERVIDLLASRISVLGSLYTKYLQKHADDLAKAKRGPFGDLKESNRIHNSIQREAFAQGCGIAQIEEDVHEIRSMIQDYFDSFNPHREWWHSKTRRGRKLKAIGDS